ncbi:hypothetical protein BIW11_04086 [Tropilaelaps mercedesae]|uniref:Uncharacterized protein n=1 Tax=Tropilaelaps mercedesae TaxID=418985 RepID=A0A1V9XBA8_9ACAR|nr:hypothetical protein BIW11_04086 [Tropilaelaps mercedesae]
MAKRRDCRNTSPKAQYEPSYKGQSMTVLAIDDITRFRDALRLITSLTGGSLEFKAARWKSFVKAVHMTLASSIDGILRGTYRHILDKATASRILPYFHI